MLTMAENHLEPQGSNIKIIERSILSGRYCFLERHKLWRTMHPTNFTILDQWFNFIITHLPMNIDFTIYLRSRPENLQQRILHRNRLEDPMITEKILFMTHNLYENWLIKKQFPSRGRLIILNANNRLEDMLLELNEKLHKSYFTFDKTDETWQNNLFREPMQQSSK